MHNAIAATRTYLGGRYEALLGAGFSDFRPMPLVGDETPAFVWIDDALAPCKVDEATGAALFDPEIGICTYILTFADPEKLRATVRRALVLRSRLLRETASRASTTDARGAWRVTLCWLVEASQRESWLAAVARLRTETSHFEEIPVEAITRQTESWSDAVATFGFPRLLFTVRRLLRTASTADETPWGDVDRAVEEVVASLREDAETSEERAAAGELAALLEQRRTRSEGVEETEEVPPRDVTRVRIQDFRNVSGIDIHLRSGTVAGGTVVHGPNGSGKSTILEALALGLCGSSARYVQFLESQRGQRVRQDGAREYRVNYLQPMGQQSREPRVGLTNEGPAPVHLADATGAESAYSTLAGTILPQEASARFVAMQPRELGAAIIGTTSASASDLLSHAGRRHDEERARQTKAWEQWGISTQISTERTARERIASVVLRELIVPPRAFAAWAGEAPKDVGSPVQTPAQLREGWVEIERRLSAVSGEIARAEGTEAQFGILRRLMQQYAAVTVQTAKWAGSIKSRLGQLMAATPAELRDWSAWLQEARRVSKAPPAGIQGKLAEATLKEQALRTRGLSARAHVKHLEDANTFLAESWLGHSPNECPTCASDLAAHGGAKPHVAARLQLAQRLVEQLREEYRQLADSLGKLRAAEVVQSTRPCPISEERRARLREDLAWLLSEVTSLDACLADPERSGALIRTLEWLLRMPEPSEAIAEEGADAAAEAAHRRLQAAYKSVARVSAGESAWKATRARLSDRLGERLNAVLPAAIQELWKELVLSMTPAPWQLPGLLEFKVDAVRTQPEADVQIRHDTGARSARFILNQGEVHVLGLGWFFCEYLLRGRWTTRLLALDDPAQEMDQPTFRDFCRLLETLIRLHRVHNIPVSVLVLLHQDDRALDAARALDGVVHQVRWNVGGLGECGSIRLFPEARGAPFPEGVALDVS